eukprot:3716563-Alexandrium_andersonii.AAC.1
MKILDCEGSPSSRCAVELRTVPSSAVSCAPQGMATPPPGAPRKLRCFTGWNVHRVAGPSRQS